MSATSLPQYRIRHDDGSEVVVPTAEELESRVARGEILPKTVIFDAGRGVWCRAGDAPLIRFIVEEAARDRGALPGWSEGDQAAASAPPPRTPQPAATKPPLKIEPPDSAPPAPSEKVEAPVTATASVPRKLAPPAAPPAVDSTRKPEPARAAETPVTPIATGKSAPSLGVSSPESPKKTDADAPAAAAGATPKAGDAPSAPPKDAGKPAAQVHTVRPAAAPMRKMPASQPPAATPPAAAAPGPVAPAASAKVDPKKPEAAPAAAGPTKAPVSPAVSPAATSAVHQPAASHATASKGAASTAAPSQPAAGQAKTGPATVTPLPPAVGRTEAPAKPIPARPAPKKVKPEPAGVVVGEIVPEPAIATVPVEALAPAAGMGRWVAAAKRRGVLVSSLVGGTAALVVIGLVVQGRNDAREEAMKPVPPVASFEAPFTADQMPEFSTGNDSSLQAELAGVPEETASVDSAPTISMPRAPVLTPLVLPGNLNVAPSYADQPVSSLPMPSRPQQSDDQDEPTLRAITQAPQVTNQARVQQALERQYPVGLRQAGIGGRVEMTFSIDERGSVQRFEIKQGSNHPELDQAALKVAEAFEFSPALRGTEPVATSVTLGITFGNRGATPSTSTARPNTPAPAANQPVPAQFDVAPQVRNANRVQQAMLSEYPIGLRDTGIGGKVEMWFYVNEQGGVERFQIGQGSGNKDLDAAALRVARVFQFTAARRGNQPVATWFSFGITFSGADPGGR
jgi:TonB family protein